MPPKQPASTSFTIPANIKQQFLPFVLNPQDKDEVWVYYNYEGKPATSEDLKSGMVYPAYTKTQSSANKLNTALNSTTDKTFNNSRPQIFSFKGTTFSSEGSTHTTQTINGDCAFLNTCPSSISEMFSNSELGDIANRLLYQYKDQSKPTGGLSFVNLLKFIPSIQIREYQPDTRLDQALNILNDVSSSLESALKGAITSSKDKGFVQAAKDVANKILQFGNNFIEGKNKIENPDKTFTNYYKADSKSPPYLIQQILDFPFIIYYQLQSSLTTNIYEIPGIVQNKELYSSQGSAGWSQNSSMSFNNLVNKIPLVGNILSKAIGNVGIHFTPWWDGAAGSTISTPEIIIEFDLFNDTIETALANFIFINTLVPNNKYLQYNVLQQSSPLYDVKLEGYNRLFACSANTVVSQKGVLRTPSTEFINRLVDKHLNKMGRIKSEYDWKTHLRTLIKIPDIYNVKISFLSLLPANFNNYIYTYAHNNDIITSYTYDNMYQPNKFNVIKNAIDNAAKKTKKETEEPATKPTKTADTSPDTGDAYKGDGG